MRRDDRRQHPARIIAPGVRGNQFLIVRYVLDDRRLLAVTAGAALTAGGALNGRGDRGTVNEIVGRRTFTRPRGGFPLHGATHLSEAVFQPDCHKRPLSSEARVMEMVYRLQEQFGSGLAVDGAPVARWRRVGGDSVATGFDPRARRRSTQHVPARRPLPVAPALDPLPDELLIQHLRKGSARAGELLLERYGEPVMRYLRRIASPALAEDLSQQTWLGVIEHLDTFKTATSPGGFKSWLFRIATNKVNDLWRSRGREKAAKEGFARNIDQEVEDAGVPADVTEQVEELRRHIEQLPEKQRQVLTLRYFADMKFVDIADMMGCPLNTALGHAHKGMTKLRRWLEAA